MKTLCLLTVLAATGQAFANVDSCDDYISRHYRKDLMPVHIQFQEKNLMGDIYTEHTAIKLFIKNVGEVNMSKSKIPMRVRINGRLMKGYLYGGVASGHWKVLNVITKGHNFLRHCRKAKVQIDLGRQAGQWGCAVFDNDSKYVNVWEANKGLCRRAHP